jgi:hypothetical protein
MYETIRNIHLQHKFIGTWITIPITAVDFSNCSFSDFTKSLSSYPAKYHIYLITKIWEREDISKDDKKLFLMEVLKTSNSLNAKNYAGILFERETNINWDPFKFQPIYDEYEKKIKVNK